MIKIYRKSDLRPMTNVPSNMTPQQEIEINTIPNYGGEVEDYDFIETEFEHCHFERNSDGVVIAIKDIAIPTLDEIRKTRNQLLEDCDWTQLPDSPISNEQKFEWATYRQSLRDFPAVVNFNNVIWPTPPEV